VAKIAIIGGGYLQLPLIRQAKKTGHDVICFDWDKNAVGKKLASSFYPVSIVNKEQVLQTCEQENVSGVLSVASDVAVTTVNYIAENMNLIGNSIESAKLSTNKYLMRKALTEAGIICPQFKKVSIAHMKNIEPHNFIYPLIIKPVDRSGSRGVFKIESEKELLNKLQISISESFIGEAIIEDFVDGHEISVESISWQGEHYILSVTDKETSGPPHFVELSHHQPADLDEKLKIEIENLTKRCLDALLIKNGASHTEFIIADSKVTVTEVGARMGGDFIGSHLVKLSTGYDYIDAIIELALGKFEQPKIEFNKYSGVFFLSEKSKHIASFINRKNEYKEIVEASLISNELKPLAMSSDRNGYFIYQSDNKFII